jgi:putative ABC transport system permease protein
MLHATLKGIVAHKLRLVLTAMSIVLGVAFVAGTFVLTDSLKHCLNGTSTEALRGVDAGVRSSSNFDTTGDLGLVRAPLPASVLDTVAHVDGVADARGEVAGPAVLVTPDGDTVMAGGSSWNSNATLSPIDIEAGHAPSGPGEAAISAATYQHEGWHLGDTVRIVTTNGSHDYQLVGTAQYAGKDDEAGSAFVVFSLPTAQAAFDRVDQFDSIVVQAAPGVGQTELQARLSAALPTGVEAVTHADLVAEAADDVNTTTQFLDIFLLTFAFIALLVGAFIIYNTFSIIVTQRTKELALMRALGASPTQVRRSVATEAVVVGVVGSAIGLGLGIVVALGLRALLSGFGLTLPTGPMIVKSRTVIAAMAMGTIVTVLSTIGPARKAAKVAPLAAMRDVGTDHRAAGRRRTVIGALVGALGVFGVINGLSGGAIALVGLGALATFVGVSMLAPVLARPAAGLVGRPLRRMGIEGALARQNAMRSARRTASTASALMIGLALVAAVLVLAASTIKSTTDGVDREAVAPYIVKADNFMPFSSTVVDELRQRPEIAAAYGVRTSPAKINGSTKPVTSIDIAALDPTNPHQALSLGHVDGDLHALDDGGLAVWDQEAKDHHWSLGDTVTVQYPDGQRSQQIEAIYEDHYAAGNYVMAETTYRQHYIDQGDMYVMISPADAANDASAKAAAQAVIDRDYPNLDVLTKDEFIADQKAQLDLIVGLITALLGLAILIALLGVANTLALSIYERTREIGLLRAVGMTRTQLRRMVRGEAAIVATFGALLGLAVGVFFGVAMVKALASKGIDTLVIPPVRLGVVVAATAVLGVLAAVLPARKAARLDVLTAITHD